MKKWSLIENGLIHTDKLTESEAVEMCERYNFFYDDIDYTFGLTSDYK